jgi:hypothetical protein
MAFTLATIVIRPRGGAGFHATHDTRRAFSHGGCHSAHAPSLPPPLPRR